MFLLLPHLISLRCARKFIWNLIWLHRSLAKKSFSLAPHCIRIKTTLSRFHVMDIVRPMVLSHFVGRESLVPSPEKDGHMHSQSPGLLSIQEKKISERNSNLSTEKGQWVPSSVNRKDIYMHCDKFSGQKESEARVDSSFAVLTLTAREQKITSNFWGKIIPNLDSYTQPNEHSRGRK